MIKEYWGFGFQILGIFILVIVNTSSIWHGKYNFPFWRKRYYWHGWRPFYKNTETKKWVWMWKHKPLVRGWIPPKHKLYWLSFFFILLGLFLQKF